jgi:Protein kinase domain
MEAATVSGYRVERVLSARIGVHTVVEAVGPDGGRVAITLLDPAVADDPHLRRHVLSLARTRASLRHPNVLPLIGPEQVENRIGLVSALAGPRTLADRLEAGPLEPAEAVAILSQVASALETGAAHGLVHRDLAPGSIVFGEDETDRVYLGDFGITVPPLPGCELVDAAQGIDYCSPEEVRGESLEPESNVYSLACILVECLTGSPPYPYDRPLLKMHAHVVEPPPTVSQRRPELPEAFDAVIARAMAKDPRERFRSPGRFMRAAGEALGVEARVPVVIPERSAGAGPAARPRREARSAARPRRARSGRWIALALPAVALCGFVAGLIDWSGDPRPASPAPAPAAAERARQAAHVEAVGAAVEDLAARRVALRRDLREARRPAGQAAAARALAGAYESTREALPDSPARGPREAAIRAGLRGTEAAYRSLASAARGRDRAAWRRAVRATERREAQLARALR